MRKLIRETERELEPVTTRTESQASELWSERGNIVAI